MNKEALRKELEDAWEAGHAYCRYRESGFPAKPNKPTYITTRLAALDDGQEGKATMKELVRQIFGDEAAEDKDIVDFYQRVHKTAIEEMALPVADGEGEKVGLLAAINILKNRRASLEKYYAKNAIGDAAVNGMTAVFNDTIKLLEAIPLLPSAVTGGMKWVKASERLPEFEKYVHAKVEGVPVFGRFYEIVGNKKFSCGCPPDGTYVIEEHFNYVEWLDEGQPAQGGKPFMEGKDEK